MFPGSWPFLEQAGLKHHPLTCSSSGVIGLAALKSNSFLLSLPDDCRASVLMLGSLTVVLKVDFFLFVSS